MRAAPLHPIFVHFSIALPSTSFAFDLFAAVFAQPSLSSAGWWSLAAAIVVTVGTITTGVISRVRVPMDEGRARSYLRAHMALGPLFFGLLLAMGSWRAVLFERGAVASSTYLAALGGVLVLMGVQGYLGGELVYRYGAEVRGSYRRLPNESTPA
jgi:uncharacterized membrane protein